LGLKQVLMGHSGSQDLTSFTGCTDDGRHEN